jgi:hypothetical protein
MNQIEGLSARGAYWYFLISILRLTHRNRFPDNRSFAHDLPLIVAYGAVMSRYAAAKDTRTADLSRFLGIPKENARRYLRQLAELGLLDCAAHAYRPGKRIARRHHDGMLLTEALRRQMTAALERIEE